MRHRDLEEAGAQIILGNTYHLLPASRRPADRASRRVAPLHRLAASDPHRQRRLPGVQPRRSPKDHRGRRATSARISMDRAHLLTPEAAVDIQARLGSDIAMVLDECLAYPASRDEAAHSMERSVRWAATMPRAASARDSRRQCD